MRTILTNANVLTPYRRACGAVVVEDNTIVEVCPPASAACLHGGKVVDMMGYYLAPGFIDLHTHGGGGHDFMDGSLEALLGGCRAHMQHGTTALLPTTLSSTDAELYENLRYIGEAAQIQDNMPEVLGAHLEGPYFASAQSAAQDPRYIKHPDPEEYQRIFERFPLIKIWSAAPELPGALAFGRWMRTNGIIASIGHSDAVYQEVVDALENGYTMLTHFFNGMSRLTRRDAKMYLGVAESGLCIDDLTVEIIADGCHLPPELLKLIYKVKGPDRVCLVTDSMRAAGQDVKESILGSLQNGRRVEIDNGVAYMPDRSSFGGSVATADRLVRVMHQEAGIPIEDAVKMMTVTPARVLGLEHRIGSIAPGMRANLIAFDGNVEIKYVMVKGKVWVDQL